MTSPRGHCLSLRARLTRAGEGRPWRAFPFLYLALAGGVAAETALPSGQIVTALDRAVEVQADGTHWLVMRYLAPRISQTTGDLDYEAVQEDLDRLCTQDGLRTAQEVGPVDQIVVVLLDRPLPRGERNPDVTQFISAYRPAPEGCVWQ